MSELKKEDVERVQKAVDALGEHFDSVQIFATRCEMGENDGTIYLSLGSGNWFTRYGQVCNWLEREQEHTRLKVRQDLSDDDS